MTVELKGLPKGLMDTGRLAADPSARGMKAFRVDSELFARCAQGFKDAGFRLVAEWASDETPFSGGFAVYAAYSAGPGFLVIKAELPAKDPAFPSITGYYPAAYRFERQIESLMGVTPSGHPDLRPWIKHEDWPRDAWVLRKSFDPSIKLPRVEGVYEWSRAEGEGVFEVPVGPVHAGIIEPGHFRFQTVGEDILNLETRFGYVHKGIEKRFEQMRWDEAVRLAGRVSGDSTVAHALGFCMAVEAACECAPPPRAGYLRAIMLECERIANHLGDIGAICNDTGFALMLYQFSILRERLLRMNRDVFGHRLLMDRVCIGGVSSDTSAEDIKTMLGVLNPLRVEFERLIRIYEDSPSFEDRIYTTGVLSVEAAKAIGAVGYVARSSGVALDARLQNPFHPYDRHAPKAPLLTSGDVHARAWVRIEEVRESLRLIGDMLRSIPDGPISSQWAPPPPGATGFSAVEGWRGEVVYWVQAGPSSEINRCMVRDPSSVNWLAIELAIRGNIVPDFPLCNKSFNQSYSGHDL